MSTSLSRTYKHYANGRHGQVHFITAQPSDEGAIKYTPLVCFHPSPTSGDMYRDLQAQLATDRVVHCPDTPGFGSSDAPPSKPTMADYGAGLGDALKNLGYGKNKKIDLFGFHTGSLCAIEVAIQNPEMIRRIVLSGVPHYTAVERQKQRTQNVTGYPYFDNPDYVGQMYRRLVLEADDAGDLTRKFYRFVDRLRAGPNGWWGPDAVFTMNTQTELPKLKAKTLLIAFNEMMTQPTRDAAKLISNATLLEMLDLPMFGFIVAPDRVAAQMRRFLDAA